MCSVMWVAGWAGKACVGLLDWFSVNVAISDHTVTAYPIFTVYDSLVGRTGHLYATAQCVAMHCLVGVTGMQGSVIKHQL